MVASVSPDAMAAIDRLLRDIRHMDTDLDKAVDERVKPVTDQTAADARTFAPVRSGALRASIEAGRLARGEAAVWAAVPYAVVQNYGGEHPVFGRGSVEQQARRFMGRAIDKNRDDFFRAVAAALDDAARKAGFH
jgi:phage gpG-like protein